MVPEWCQGSKGVQSAVLNIANAYSALAFGAVVWRLRARRKGHSGKVVVGRRLGQETTMGLKWIAEVLSEPPVREGERHCH